MPVGEKRLLIVDDDTQLLRLLRDAFEAESYQVTVATDAPDALAYIQAAGLPHLVLIDLDLPSMHGYQLSERLKAMGDVPIIFITGTDDPKTIADSLRRYADDYVIKPISVAELLARVARVLSRIVDFGYVQSPVIPIDEHLQVDFGRRRLLKHGRPIPLTPTEVALLHVLMRNQGRVVPSETLIARVWPTSEVYEDTLRVHVHRLRRKLEEDIHRPAYIHTERGIGYRFTVGRGVAPDPSAPA